MNFLEHPIVPLLGRLMMTYIFATSGIGKIFGWSGNVAYMNTRHLPLIPVLLAAAMVIEVAGFGGFVGWYAPPCPGVFIVCLHHAVRLDLPHQFFFAAQGRAI